MDKYQLLELKRAITVWEAAQMLTRTNDHSVVESAKSLICEAIEAGELAAKIVRWDTYYADHGTSLPNGNINQMETTVQRTDLDSWMTTRGLSIPTAPSGTPAQGRNTNAAATHFIEPNKGSIPARFVNEVAEEMEAGGRRITTATIWSELAKRVGKSIIEDTKPDAFLCNVGEDDLYRLTREAVRGILNRRKTARLAHVQRTSCTDRA